MPDTTAPTSAEIKQAFWDAIDADLPDSIASVLDVTFACSTVTGPTDVDGAIIEQGKLAAKLNKLLDDLDGLSLAELILHVGQKNVTSKLMLLAGLEYLGAVDKDDKEGFVVIAPTEGQESSENPLPFKAKATSQNVTAISVRIDGDETLELKLADGIFTAVSILTPGDHTAVFFTPDTKPGQGQTVHFAMTEYELVTFPADGDEVPPVFQARVEIEGDDAITDATVRVEGVDPVIEAMLSKQPAYIGKSVADGLIDLTGLNEFTLQDWVELVAAFLTTNKTGQTTTKRVAFTVRKPPALPQ